MRRWRMGLVWMLVLMAAACVASAQNPSFNGGFEAVEAGKPVGWKTNLWSGHALFSLVAQGHSGGHSVLVTSQKGGDAGWFAMVPVRPQSRYRLSAWIKTEGVEALDGQGALINLHSRPEHTAPIVGTKDWTRVEMPIDTGPDDVLQINCLLGYFGQAKGKAWYDDVQLDLVSTQELKPEVGLAGTLPRTPISKYIYSQFIEHLGRCIYGGIWAEMLDDRKFYDAVGTGSSPWKILGGATVTMDTHAPFVGDHSPQVALTGGKAAGILQGSLALVAGKTYTGRIWLAGGANAAPVTVSLVWGEGANERQTVTIGKLAEKFAKTSLKFVAGAATRTARLEITSAGSGSFRVGTVSLMPADNVRGMRPDTLQRLRELNAPLYRWPGGNFVSGYDWRDGLGDSDRRPPRKNPAWQGIEHNDFGLHEFMDFCREVNTEPLVVVNTGFGDAHSAAEEVEYVNGKANSPMTAWRAKNGRREPWNVVWWGVGNEMWGPWQLGYMALNQYVFKHNQVETAMRHISPNIKTVGSGDAGAWSEGMLKNCADHMTLLSEHFYCQERPSVAAHVAQMPAAIRAKAAAHRRYRETIPQLKGKDIRIAMDEWNYWYGPYVYGELGTQYFLKDALGIAAGLHEYYRNSDIIYMANYAQTVNVIGAIKTSKTEAILDTTGLVLKLYREHFGMLPLALTGTPQPLDVSVALTDDKKTVTFAVVNPTGEEQTLRLTLSALGLTGSGKCWRIGGSDPMAYNAPGKAPGVQIVESPVSGFGDSLKVAPYSIALYALDRR